MLDRRMCHPLFFIWLQSRALTGGQPDRDFRLLLTLLSPPLKFPLRFSCLDSFESFLFSSAGPSFFPDFLYFLEDKSYPSSVCRDPPLFSLNVNREGYTSSLIWFFAIFPCLDAPLLYAPRIQPLPKKNKRIKSEKYKGQSPLFQTKSPKDHSPCFLHKLTQVLYFDGPPLMVGSLSALLPLTLKLIMKFFTPCFFFFFQLKCPPPLFPRLLRLPLSLPSEACIPPPFYPLRLLALIQKHFFPLRAFPVSSLFIVLFFHAFGRCLLFSSKLPNRRPLFSFFSPFFFLYWSSALCFDFALVRCAPALLRWV